jgi:hypothetical protein
MRVRFHINQDFAAGVMFALFGVAGLWFGRHYPVGTSLRMGPGYMPWMLCWLLILFGAGIAVRGALTPGEALTRWYLRPLALVSAGLMVFALLIENVGLPGAVIGTVIVGALGGQQFRLIEVIPLAIGLAIGAVAIFIWGLGLPMAIWPR